MKELRQEIQELRSKPPLRYDILDKENEKYFLRDDKLCPFFINELASILYIFRSALRTPTVKFESNNVTDDETSLLHNEENTASNSTDYFSARASGSTTGKSPHI